MGHRTVENVFIWIALGFYAVNYTAGWLLYFKIIRMTKLMHRILFAGVLISLSVIAFYQNIFTLKFLLVILSLAVLFALPFGKKGGKYHILMGSAGILIYIIFLMTYLKLF